MQSPRTVRLDRVTGLTLTVALTLSMTLNCTLSVPSWLTPTLQPPPLLVNELDT